MHLHPTEVPIMLEGAIVPVGYKVLTSDFEFTAIYENDGTVNTYVEWGDDQAGDMANHDSMSEAKRWLDTLIKASEPKPAPVKIDLPSAINESVEAGLKKAELPDTPQNRLDVLFRMHRGISTQGMTAPHDASLITCIEEEILRLQELS